MLCYDASTTTKHPGEFWKKMKPLIPNTGCKKSVNIILVENDCVITEPSSVAEIFNKHFVEMVNTERKPIFLNTLGKINFRPKTFG